MAIKELFAHNGYVRNVIFIISSSLGILLLATYLLMGHSFLYTAPIFIMATLIGLLYKPSKIFLPFCVGGMLQFGLFSGVMGLLIVGPVLPVFINLFIGTIGYLLLVTSIWQAVIGEWKLPRPIEKFIHVVAILGLIFSIIITGLIEKHGVRAEPSPHYKTY